MSTQESGWLIERYLYSELHYWSPDSEEIIDAFTSHPENAIRFARKEDADLILSRLLGGNGRVAQHVWADGKLLA